MFRRGACCAGVVSHTSALGSQAATASRGEARQDLARHRSHAGADVLPQAAEGLEREENQRRAVRHGRFRRVSAATLSQGKTTCPVLSLVCVAGHERCTKYVYIYHTVFPLGNLLIAVGKPLKGLDKV